MTPSYEIRNYKLSIQEAKSEPTFLEKCFVVIAMLFFTDGFIGVLELKSGIDVIPGDHDPFVFYFSYPIYLMTAFLFMRCNLDEVVALLRKEKFIACLIGVAFLSALWSDFPLISLRRSVAITGTTLFGIYLAVRYPPEEQLKLVASALAMAAISSLFFGLFLPDYGIDAEHHEGAWRGIFVQKNGLGRLMVISALVFILLEVRSKKHRLIKLFFFGLSISLILLSTSKTSLILFLILLMLLPLYYSLRWHFHIRIFLVCLFFMIVIISGAALLDNINIFLNAIGRDPTLTGRTELWETVITMIEKRPLLGYGYNAFWLGFEGKASAYVWQLLGWKIVHAHNGYLDLWLELGLLGIILFVAGFFQVIKKAVHLVSVSNSSEALWPLIYFTFVLLFDLNESYVIMRHNSIFWVLYVSTTMSLFSIYDHKETETIPIVKSTIRFRETASPV